MIFLRYTVSILIAAQILTAQPLSLHEAVVKTLFSHPDARTALYRLEESRADLGSVGAELLPEITLNGDYFPTKTLVVPAAGAFGTREHSTTHIDVTATYTLWDFGRTRNRVKAAAYGQESASLSHENARLVLIERVWQAYYTVAYLDKLIAANRQSVAFYEALHQQSIQMRKTGLKTQADEERFYASLLEAKEALSGALHERKKTQLALSLLVGEPLTETVIIDDFVRRSQTKLSLKNDSEWRKELLDSNKELRILSSKVNQAKSLFDASEAQQYGTIATVASYGHDESLSPYNTRQVGVKASIPIYTGGNLTHQKEKSRLAVMVAQEELRSRGLALWLELYGAVTDAKRLEETISAKGATMEAAAKAVAITKGRYAEGLVSYIDVLEAKTAYENAQTAQSGAMLQKIAALAKIATHIPPKDAYDDALNP